VTTPDRDRLRDVLRAEEKRFAETHRLSSELYEKAKASLLAGVPMPWMTEWAGPHPVFAATAEGAHCTDVDGNEYVDFCLGDTGAMTGHAPRPTVEAIAEQAQHGITLMLPTEDSTWVGTELQRRFGLPYWQFALTATDANRFTIRLARWITGRPKILVYSWCYHGTVDETFAIQAGGRTRSRPDNIGPPVDPALTTVAIEWNDVEALEAALAGGEIACVLAEPAMTNIGIVLPEPGYHDALRSLTREHGSLLAIDETHTICAGPGGYTAAHGLEPDFVTIGKPLAAGVPAAAYGMSDEVADRVLSEERTLEASDVGGIGGTLSGNALSLAAMRATLESVLTDDAFAETIALGGRFEAGVREAIASRRLPWHVTRLGCRVEYAFSPRPPRNGGEAAAARDRDLDRFLHLHALNRGILMTPFHNMALISPATTPADVDRHTEAFAEAVGDLFG
jgi:glutamate-1-semialdehyde 2,1-aminomutase